MMTVMMMLMCVVYFQRARQEIIKVGGWVGLRKMEGKMGGSREKNEKISTTVKPERERESFGCALFGKKKELSAGRGLCFVLCSFLVLVLVLVLFQGLHVQLGLRVYIYSRDVGVLDLYSSVASDASVCIWTPFSLA